MTRQTAEEAYANAPRWFTDAAITKLAGPADAAGRRWVRGAFNPLYFDAHSLLWDGDEEPLEGSVRWLRDTYVAGDTPQAQWYTTIVPEFLPELAALPNWVGYKLVPSKARPGKTDKIPYDLRTGQKAKVNDAATWCDFDAALAGLRERGGFLDGLGFQLGESPERKSGIVGVDLDGCLDDAKRVAGWALAIVRRLDSYTEVSPSGKGLRIFCRGELPPGGRKKGDIEFYDCGRFLTVTGNVFHNEKVREL